MYAGRVACCPLVSHAEYGSARPIKVRKKTGQADRTDGLQTVILRLPTARQGQRKNKTIAHAKCETNLTRHACTVQCY